MSLGILVVETECDPGLFTISFKSLKGHFGKDSPLKLSLGNITYPISFRKYLSDVTATKVSWEAKIVA